MAAPKKAKYSAKWNESWTTTYTWLTQVGDSTAKCKLCNTTFVFHHEGEAAIKAHLQSKAHQKVVRSMQNSNLTKHFKPVASSSEADEVTIAELALVYHNVKHQLSYNSFDCTVKLITDIFPDHKIVQNLRCARTKASALVEFVLGPSSFEHLGDDLKLANQTYRPYSLSSDASNKGNVKLFPLIISYFVPEEGIKFGLLDFYSDQYETAEAITTKILECLKEKKLPLSSAVAYSADNAAVNYGRKNSVFQKLGEQVPGLLPANCFCHVFHNAAKFACKKIPPKYDIETLVNKIYSEFSTSTVKDRNLKECFDFFNLEYVTLYKNIATRWLSLTKCVDQLIKAWPAIKKYFIELGEDTCDAFVWNFFKGNENEIEDDRIDPTLSELYLNFYSHFLHLLTVPILSLEREDITAAEIHDIINNVTLKLRSRKESSFFGSVVKNGISKLNANERQSFTTNATTVYTRAIEYIDKYYDTVEKQFLKLLSSLNISEVELVFDDVIKVATILKAEINEDLLFDEIVVTHNIIEQMRNEKKLNTLSMWVAVFKAEKTLTELTKIVSKAFSIPASQAKIERIFSLMNLYWSDTRNRCSLSLIKAELGVAINFNMNCTQFHKYLRTKNPKILGLIKHARSQEKYKFKCSE